MERLGRYERPFRDEFRHYPDAGHGIQPPYLPATPGTYYYGGDLEGNAAANEDSWRCVCACSMDVYGVEAFARGSRYANEM
jgi:hypothetical protein